MENNSGDFPRHGKKVSTPWKKPSGFSTPWKNFGVIFHAMENRFPRRGKRAAGLVLAAGLAAGAGCASVRTSRLGVPEPSAWEMSASASAAEQGPEQARDGQTNTWWRSGPELPQWIQADLGREAMVCGVSLQWGRPHGTAYGVLTSLDGEQWSVGFETAAGDGGWDQILMDPVRARYVRLTVKAGAGSAGAALEDLSVLGLDQRPEARVNGQAAPVAAALLDGRAETFWASAEAPALLELDLRRTWPVGSLRLDWGTGGFASNVVVEVSTNRADWIAAGQIQSHGGDFDVLMLEEVMPARYLRLAFGGSSGAEGFAVAGLALRGPEGTARPRSLLELAASQAPEGMYPDVLQRRPVHWTAAGGLQAGTAEGLLDEWGGFAPDARRPVLTPLIASEGGIWTAHQAQSLEHRLAGDGVPLPETVWRLPSGLALRIRAMPWPGTSPALAAVEYELRNESLMVQTGRLAWVVRPLRLPPVRAGGGLAPIFRLRRTVSPDGWQELWADGRRLYAVPDADLPFGCAAFDGGDASEFFRRGETPSRTSVHDEEGLASAAWWRDFDLSPGERVRMVILAASPEGGRRRRGGMWPDPAGGADQLAAAFERHWDEAVWAWRSRTGAYAPGIARPEAMECLHAQVGWLLGLRESVNGGAGEDLESIAWKVAALLRTGREDAAREWVERTAGGMATDGWVPAVLLPDGTPAPRIGLEGRHGSQGQLAFMVMETYRFTRDIAFLQRHYPAMRHAMGWLRRLRGDTAKSEARLPLEERELLEGLLPASPARPGHPRPGHFYADQYWALLGWKELRTAAVLLGKDEDAEWADRQYGLLRASVERSLRAHLERRESAWLPAVAEETEAFDPAAVALLFWPCAETDLAEPHELQSSLDAFFGAFLEDGTVSRDPAAEAQMLVPLAAMGRGDYAREILYALLDGRRPPGWQAWAAGGAGRRPPGAGPGPGIGFMPDLRAAAAYVLGVRGLAVREAGRRLDLFCGAPAEWLQHGDGYHVYGAPTAFGPLDLRGRWHRERFTATIGGGARPPEGYRLWWPRHGLPDRVLANGSHLRDYDAQGVDLPHDFQGTVEAVFPFAAPWPRDP